MKKFILILSLAVVISVAFFTITFLSGCYSREKKLENADDRLQEAKMEVLNAEEALEETISDSISNYQQFKMDAEQNILAYEKSIAELKLKIAGTRIENRAEYEKKLAELEQKNTKLRHKLSDYKEDEQAKWASFRAEFVRDLDELGQALKDFTVKNK